MYRLETGPIDINEIARSVFSPAAGGVVVFIGTVRDDGTDSLEIEAYEEMALSELGRIHDEAIAKFSLHAASIVHRTGRLPLGEVIVVIAASSAHRAMAFEGCRYIIEELKKSVPLWKKEYRGDSVRWITGH